MVSMAGIEISAKDKYKFITGVLNRQPKIYHSILYCPPPAEN